MSQKVLVPFLLFCFLQLHLFSCETIQEIISDIQPQLQQLRYKVRTTAATSNIRLSIANSYVSDRISISSTTIQKQLSALEKTVQETQYSSINDEDLRVCIVQEQLGASTIDADQFSACRRNEQIADIRRKIVVLKGLLAEIDQTLTACLVDSGVETEALRICLQNSIDGIGVSLQEQEQLIGTGIDEVIIGADKCVFEVEEELNERIVGVAQQFSRCVASSDGESTVKRDLDKDDDDDDSDDDDSNDSNSDSDSDSDED